ncbi:MAG TPA: hypothetical protein VGX46_12545 [Vicinamibacterales bacterium]|nr:hypothetical protein [Vicinamibacterales bacterium]
MKHRTIATAIALLVGLSMPRAVAAKGHGGGHSGGGHSGGGHSGGGHSGGGHSGGGHSGGHSGGGHASDGHSNGGQAGSVRAAGGHASSGASSAVPRGAAPTAPVATPARGSRPPDGQTIIGTAVPRSAGARDVFVVTPSILMPRFVRPYFTGLGFGFGIRPFGYGYGPTYYGFGYNRPLFCETTVDCDVVPVTGTVDVPRYDVSTPEIGGGVGSGVGSGSMRLDVQPAFAQIVVDGEYVGTVEDFRSLAGLEIAAGLHRVEFRAPGYDPLVVDVRIAAGRVITYRGALKPSSP